jgi:hypothetical protein
VSKAPKGCWRLGKRKSGSGRDVAPRNFPSHPPSRKPKRHLLQTHANSIKQTCQNHLHIFSYALTRTDTPLRHYEICTCYPLSSPQHWKRSRCTATQPIEPNHCIPASPNRYTIVPDTPHCSRPPNSEEKRRCREVSALLHLLETKEKHWRRQITGDRRNLQRLHQPANRHTPEYSSTLTTLRLHSIALNRFHLPFSQTYSEC